MKQLPSSATRDARAVHEATKRTRLSFGLALAIALTSGLAFPAAAQTSAAQQDQTVDFDIPAGSLSSTLLRFGQQSRLQFNVGSDLTDGKRSAGVKGKLSAEAALRALLAGSGLTFRFSGPRTVVIEAAPEVGDARVLGPLRIEGASSGTAVNGINGSSDTTATEGTNSYTTGAMSIAGKSPQSIKDTPQSVTVVTQQRMQDQNITNFTDLMTKSTGISVVTGTDSGTSAFYSRGFAIDRVQVDGGAPMTVSDTYVNGNSSAIDLAIYDHAEILRGADGLYNGYGDPGGVINLVRKRPLDQQQVIVEASYGSWSNFRTMIDASAPLGFDGKLRGRAVLAYEDRDFFYDVANSRKTTTYGVLEYDGLPATTFRAGFSLSRSDATPFGRGLPRYEDGSDLALSRDTCLCFPWNRRSSDTDEYFLGVDHDFNDQWSAKLNITQSEQFRSQKIGTIMGAVNASTMKGPTFASGIMGKIGSTQFAVDATLLGSFAAFGREQRVTAGMNYMSADGAGGGSYRNLLVSPAMPIDVFDFDPFAYVEPASSLQTNYRKKHDIAQYGGYLSLGLHLIDPLRVNLGVRYSGYKYDAIQHVLCQVANPAAGCPNVGAVSRETRTNYSSSDFSWPPMISASYALSESLTAYASYTDIYRDQSTYVTTDGQPIEPLTGGNMEVGLKWEAKDGALNASLSLFRLRQVNYALFVGYGDYESSNGTLPDGLHSCCYSNEADRERLSEGLDLELTGEIMDGLQVAFGYTYNETSQEGSYYGANQGQPLVTQVPKHLLKLWGTYQFGSGQYLSRLSIGGGLTAQTASYTSGSACVEFVVVNNPDGSTTNRCTRNAPFDFTQGSYAIMSARIGYALDAKWNVALNINNIADTTYYQTAGLSTGGNWYGEPRSYMLSLRGRF